MKKALLVLSSFLALTFSVNAQQFFPDWYFGIKGGVGETVGETNWQKLLSPAAALNVGYQFNPVFGLRGDLAGWQAKGALPLYGDVYKFNYAQAALDATFDIANLFAGYKERVVNPYVFIGAGANYRFNNDEANAIASHFYKDNYLWDGGKVSVLGRAGLGIDFRLSDAVALELEAVANGYSDKFNSKVGDIFDYQINALAGLKFNFGAAKKKAAALAAAEAAEAARLAAERAAAEAARLAAERAAAEKAAADAEAARLAAERAAAERAAAEAAARARARAITENVLFVIDQWKIRPSEQEKIDHVVSVMNQYPEAVVTISAYADKQTGNPRWNMTLSQHRAEVVAEALKAAGIAASRITTEYFGDTVNPFDTAPENRVSVLVTR